MNLYKIDQIKINKIATIITTFIYSKLYNKKFLVFYAKKINISEIKYFNEAVRDSFH